jgi:hypothetical protein
VWARGPVNVELTRAPRISRSQRTEQAAWTAAAADELQGGPGELLDALRAITARLDALERGLLDRAHDNEASELVRRLDELPRLIGREVRGALRAGAENRQPRSDRAAG